MIVSFIKLLLIVINIAGSFVFMFFLNHLIGFIFGFSFKSIGKPTLEILGIEILSLIIMAVVHYGLNKAQKRLSGIQ